MYRMETPESIIEGDVGAVGRCVKAMVTLIKMLPLLIIIAVVVLIVYYFIYGIYMIMERKKTINSQWATYKCKPYSLPFAGWFIGPSNTNPSSNFIQCAYSMHTSFYEVLKQEFVTMFDSVFSILRDQERAIQDIRKMTNYMRNSFEQMASDIYGKMYDAYFRISSLFAIFLKVMGNMFTIMSDGFNILLYAYYSLTSLWRGPVGKIGRFFCFAPDTLIKMADGSSSPIRDIHPGDKTAHGRVTMTMKSDASEADVYSYRDVIVSGVHLVWENGQWLRVNETLSAKRVDYSHPHLYCYNCTGSQIQVNDIIFADYMETANPHVLGTIHQIQLRQLNEKTPQLEKDEIEPLSEIGGVNGNVILSDNSEIPISKLQIGDKLLSGGRVLALIKISDPKIKLCQTNNTIFNSREIISLNGGKNWQEAHNNPNLIEPNSRDSPLYQMITDKNQFMMRINKGNTVIVRDYIRSAGDEMNDKIDAYVEMFRSRF